MAFTIAGLQRWLLPFLPGLVCLPLWAFLMTDKGVWMEAFSHYYPMSLAMVLGCFIAGSTPLGGAIVAFPVAVLVIKFTPVQGRDFGALIQSVGMTAAAYMIFIRKRHLVNAYLIVTSCVASTVGVIMGFCIDLPAFWVNVVYMTYTAVFAGLLFYYKHMAHTSTAEADAPVKVCKENEQKPAAGVKTGDVEEMQENAQNPAADVLFYQHMARAATAEAYVPVKVCKENEQKPAAGVKTSDCKVFKENEQNPAADVKKVVVAEEEREDVVDMRLMLVTGGLFLSLILGGLLSAKVASGADTLAYVYGVFIYNSVFPMNAISESSLTACSVVIMAYTSVVVAIVRLVQGDVSREVFLCWGAVLWIVVFGAPVGSLMLTRSREILFRRLFYVLAVGQFATFAVLKVKGNFQAWAVICSTMLATGLCVALHVFCCFRARPKRTVSDVV